MAGAWAKSLQCKSRAYDDVYHPKELHRTSTSCRNSYQNLKDVVNVDYSKPKPKLKPKPIRPDPFSSPAQSVKQKPKRKTAETTRVRRTLFAPMAKGSGQIITGLGEIGFGSGPFFPSVEELGEGHPSRNVVEIIFGTRWGPGGFSGRVEMVFKIQSPARSLKQFEEYRELVKLRAGAGLSSGSVARCVADGNEMMRFHCPGPTAAINGLDGATSDAICTYTGSAVAHESVGGGKGRRAMMVCRVIAGRVLKKVWLIDPRTCKGSSLGEFDSVSGENGELLVFDSRAVLPCFIVIYKL